MLSKLRFALVIVFLLILVVVNLQTIAASTSPIISKPLIYGFKTVYGIKLDDYKRKSVNDYTSLNDFFTREIESRDMEEGVVSPVDGKILQRGSIDGLAMIQAKGKKFTLPQFLQVDDPARMENGDFVTIYLAPYNYHRVHMPCDGTLVAVKRITGKSLPVNMFAVNNVSGLYNVNERVVMVFDVDGYYMIVVLVGALFVDSIDYATRLGRYKKGDELGKFNFGSTVVLLFEQGLIKNIVKGTVHMGRTIAQFQERQ